MSIHDDVRAFHKKYGHPVRETPVIPPDNEMRFRLKLITEEYIELMQAVLPGAEKELLFLERSLRTTIESAIVNVDLPALMDAAEDLDYVVEGTRAVCGVDGRPIHQAVQEANMSKDPVYVQAKDGHHQVPDSTAKPTKPAGWKPPDVLGKLLDQGWDHRAASDWVG